MLRGVRASRRWCVEGLVRPGTLSMGTSVNIGHGKPHWSRQTTPQESEVLTTSTIRPTMIEAMSRSQTRELDMLRHIRAVIALSLIIIAGPAEAGQLAAPVAVETRDLVLNGGFFTYDNTFTTVDPSTQVTIAGFVDGRNPSYGHMQDVIADFSLQGVSTSTPVPLLLDVSQVLTNGSSSFPFPVTLEIGVVGATGTINPADFPTLAAWQPPGTPFWTMLTPGNYPIPETVSVDITSAIANLESQGYQYAEVYVGTTFSSTEWGPPQATFSFDPSAVPEPASLILLALGIGAVAIRSRSHKPQSTR